MPGEAFTREISSDRVLAGTLGLITKIRSEKLIGATATKSFINWKGLFCTKDSLTVCVLDIIRSVYPSAGDFATKSVPMMDPAPGLSSTIKDCFSSSWRRCAIKRA